MDTVTVSGHAALWEWFGLSRASFITIPRILAHAMPDEWQAKMAALLDEYDDTFTDWPEGWGCRVQFTMDGKAAKTPDWLLDCRHPNQNEINKLRA